MFLLRFFAQTKQYHVADRSGKKVQEEGRDVVPDQGALQSEAIVPDGLLRGPVHAVLGAKVHEAAPRDGPVVGRLVIVNRNFETATGKRTFIY